MSEDEKFHFSAGNVILLIIFSILLAVLIFVSIRLHNVLNSEKVELPELRTTDGRFSTSVTSTEEYTTETTTAKVVPEKSPYYAVNYDELLSDEVYSKSDLTREEATIVAAGYADLFNSLFNVNDNSRFDIATVIENNKSDETDVYTDRKGNVYGKLYNLNQYLDKYLYKGDKSTVLNISHNRISVLAKNNDDYFRIKGFDDITSSVVYVDTTILSMTDETIKASIRYYTDNYEELGYTAPNYSTYQIELKYDENRWKVSSYYYPLY